MAKLALILRRPELFGAEVREALADFCDVLTCWTPRNRMRARAIWVDPSRPLTLGEADQLLDVRYVLTNTTDTGHVDQLFRDRDVISLQGMDLSEIWSTADFAELLIRLALRPRSRDEAPGRMIAGANVLILGMHEGKKGRVATQLEDRLRALGARVVVCAPANLCHLAGYADVLSVNLPALPQYARVVNGFVLRAMKDGGVLVNTARQSLVDLEAMRDSLRAGRLARYATDFWVGDDAGGRILQWNHVAGYTAEDLRRTQRMIIAALKQRIAR